MGLPELLAALERDARAEMERLAAGAASEAAALTAAAADAAGRREASELAAARRELAAAEAAALAEATREERLAELGARAELLARAAAAAATAAATAEPALPPAAVGALLAAARRYLPGAGVAVRCPPALAAAVHERVSSWAWRVEETGGEPLAAIETASGTRVELGLAAVLASRWSALAPGVLRALEGR